jgi:hypothetical protein
MGRLSGRRELVGHRDAGGRHACRARRGAGVSPEMLVAPAEQASRDRAVAAERDRALPLDV